MDEYIPQPAQKPDYYTNDSSRTVRDFCIGFFGIWIVLFILYYATALLFDYLFKSYDEFFMGSIIFYVVLGIAAIPISNKAGRRYIGVGILASFLVPVLVFGACMLLMRGF